MIPATSMRYVLSDIPGFNEMVNSSSSNTNILKLNKVECRTSNNTSYTVIRYDKPMLAHDLISSYGLCRSVIVNSQNKVVSFAPPKSISGETFIKNYNEDSRGIVAEEFVEGTMVNAFWDPSIGLNGG